MEGHTGAVYSWETAVHEDYEVLSSTEGWSKCEKCGEFPRVWTCDHVNSAKCRCFHKWDNGISALSPTEAMFNRRMPYEEYKKLLMESWNKHLESKK